MNKKPYDSSKKEESFFLLHQPSACQLEGQLLLANRLFQSMIEGVFITDMTGVIEFINPAFSSITGYGEEVIGLTPRILQSGKHDASFYRKMWRDIEREGQWKGEVWNKRKNGELYIQWTTITRITDDAGKPLYYAAVLTDMTEQKKKEQQLQEDLLLAREVQKGALSKSIKDEHVHIEGVYLPSEMLGGDMYAWYKIDNHRYGIFLMDVMGHGVAAALVCMSVRSLLRGIINEYIEPDKVLLELNHHVFSLFHDEDSLSIKNYYLTGIYVMINIKEKIITYASAGHPPGFLLDGDGSILELDVGSVPLGMLPELDVQTGVYHYHGANTKVILYTDGIIEHEHKNTRKNIEQLKGILNKNRHLGTKQILNQTIGTLLNQVHSLKFQDDATVIAVTIY